MRSYTVVIDEDVPLADKATDTSRYQHPLSWLLTKLKVEESFVYPATTGEDFNRLRSIASSIDRRTGKKFATRTVKDHEGVSRLRFWRTK